MSEREQTRFKVTDRRKFNPDGSLREVTESEEVPDENKAQVPTQEAAAANVGSFAGETAKQPEASRSSQEDVSATDAKGSSVSADSEAGGTAAGQAERAYAQARGTGASEPPDASFLSLVNMLGVEAAMHLGLLQNPGEEPPPLDLETARQLIDTLGMLQAKTRGNLSPDEDRLLDSILADLRMRFVEISRGR